MIEITGYRSHRATMIAVIRMPSLSVYSSYKENHSAGEILNAPIYCERMTRAFRAITSLVHEIENAARRFGE